MIRLSLPRLHKTFITDRGRPYTDTPVLILPGILKSSQPIGDDPNLCMALDLTYNIVVTRHADKQEDKIDTIDKIEGGAR